MLFWAAEPSHKPGTLHRMTPANYFAIYYNIESHRNRIADLIPLTPLFQDEPTDTVVTCCLNLLRKGSYDDEEAQATLFVASRLAALFPSEFVQAKVHREFMITLWTRFRFSTNNMLGWRLSAASMAFFTYASMLFTPLTTLIMAIGSISIPPKSRTSLQTSPFLTVGPKLG